MKSRPAVLQSSVVEAERNRVLAGERVSRAQIEATGEVSLDQIRAALAALDHERAALLAIAHARKAEVPYALIADILPGIELPQMANALIAIGRGDRRELLEVLERRCVPATKEGAEIEALVLYAAWKAGADPARVIPELRRLSVRSLSAEGFALLATIAAASSDPHVAAATKHIATFAKEYAKQVTSDERAMSAKIDDVIASLPAEVEASHPGGFTVRAGKQIGRNDPCPCGSGLKYKKCCADKPAAAPSPIPGLSWDEFLGSGAGKMTEQHVRELELRDLARVDLTQLSDQALHVALTRFEIAHGWDHAERALATIEGRNPPHPDNWRGELVHALVNARQLERARPHIVKLDPDAWPHHYLELAIADGKAWPAIEEAALRALRSDNKVDDIELAYSLLRAAPALGIYIMRANIGTLHVDDPDEMLEAVEDARDQLNLAPNDPAWDVLDELTVRENKDKTDEGERLRAQLQESSGRVDQLERMLATMRGELDAARTQPAAALARAPEAERPSGLEQRVRELEALIREGNAERRELRQKLQSAEPKRTEDHRSRRAAPEVADGDDAETEAIEQGARGTVLPRFDKRFVAAIEEVPAPVAAEAMRTIGTLAAGDGFAWRNVKQAKDMARQVLMARVGIHHRLLFRMEDGALDVLDLITREQLMTTLKRLRALR
jgi:hypothetical protein